jgi:hypothetical protein
MKKTDHELLEAAARAAGLPHLEWTPGDALRVAVALNLHAARTSISRVSCWAERADFGSDAPGSDVHTEVAESWYGEDMRAYAERYGHNWRLTQLEATMLCIFCAAAGMRPAQKGGK